MQDADRDAGPGPLDQRIAKGASDRVVLEDVILEQHDVPRGGDRVVPGVEVCLGVDQEFERIAVGQGRARSTAERLLRKQACTPAGAFAGAGWCGERHGPSVAGAHRIRDDAGPLSRATAGR